MRVIDRNEHAPAAPAALEIRRRSVGALVLRLDGEDDQAFFRSLDVQLREMPDFLLGKPIILDLTDVAAANRGVDLIRVVRQLRTRKLVPIGVQSGNATLIAAAQGAGLALFDAAPDEVTASPGPAPVAGRGTEDAGRSPAAKDGMAAAGAARDALLWTTPVRSGQQIVCDWGDIIVTTSVGSGAELIASGHIHVYGALRGRALAGVNGNTKARVFCQSLEAELIAIAGLYRVSDDFDRAVWRRPVQVFLRQDSLCVEKVE
ncbi:MAG: septum formation inhibitor MinC [Alphaproteobacteria bacterium]|jgi:septum site-determining protein MinC|nr:septum formation inhibitor MinC [Alphaproteobacteria bacterium]